MSQQLDLFGDNEAHAADLEAKRKAARPAPTDPNVNPEEIPRLGGQNARVLARLRAGRATNVELSEASGAKAINSRISDVRQWLRKNENKNITKECVNARSGIYVYEIVRL